MSPLPPLLLEGDCLDELKRIPDESIDAIVTDPPYGLGFMGKKWDIHTPLDFERWCEAWATECLRILKPGGHMLAFGGTRTWHRLAAGIEDAGFEIRDSIAWLYGSGFPKSLDVSKAIDKAAGVERHDTYADSARVMDNDVYGKGLGVAKLSSNPATDAAREWDGWGTALKPAFEPIVVARKPLGEKTVAANVLAHGTGALNIDASRVAWGEGGDRSAARKAAGYSDAAKKALGTAVAAESDTGFAGAVIGMDASGGRWPANVVLDESQAAALDAQTGTLTSGVLAAHHKRAPKEAGILGAYGSAEGQRGYGDSGGASRFFFVARRENGTLESCEIVTNAGSSSSPRSDPVATAQRDAATSALPEGQSMSLASSAPSTNGTQKRSKKHAANGMPMILNIDDEYSLAPQRAKPTPNGCPASFAVASESDTTRITTSPLISSGIADPITFNDTSSSTGPGVLDSRFRYVAKAPKSERPIVDGVAHATVKPLTLMRWLIRLVTPPGGVIVDPFAGSGATLEAAYLEGFESIGVEMTPDYWPLIQARIARVVAPNA